MARKPMPWFRFYTEAPSDRKVRRLKPEHRWVWVCVLCAARMSDTPGELWVAPGEPMTVDDLADLAGVTPRAAKAALDHMAQLGLIEGSEPWTVPAFTARQFASDTSTERVRAHRKKKARNGDGTLQERSSNGRGNAPETETETESVTTPSNGFTPRGSNPLEDDHDRSELRARRIARTIDPNMTDATLIEVRMALHKHGWQDDATIAELAAARCWHLQVRAL